MSESALDRLQNSGIKGADAVLLLAICLAKNEQDVDLAEDRARELLRRTKLVGLGDLATIDLQEATDLEPFEILRVLCGISLGRKVGMAGKSAAEEIVSTPEDAAKQFMDLQHETKEHFCALFLNTKNGVIARRTIHIGTLNMSLVGVREVFREAVRENACSVIVAHNHPSGDPTPSPDDIDVTHKLASAGDLLDIPLRDHIIMGHGKWNSLKRLGVL